MDNDGQIKVRYAKALEKIDALEARLAEAERALRKICAVDKAAPGRKDCHIWADMLAIASAAAYGRDSFMSLDELTDSAPAVESHEWFQHPRLPWRSCRKCGIVERRDGKNKACVGKVVIVPRPADSASAVQPERCCLDYPRCDCNSPPEPDDDWLCFQRPAQPKVTP